jgi:hypothetical protein
MQASKLIQYGGETITEGLKVRRNNQYDGSNPAKIAALTLQN